jgi:hypothetical protein
MKVLGEPAECTGDVYSKPMGVHGIHRAWDASRKVGSMHVWPGKSVDATVERQIAVTFVPEPNKYTIKCAPMFITNDKTK